MRAATPALLGLGPARVYAATLEPASASSAGFACLASAAAHALIAAAFAALWIAPWQLQEERPRTPPPPPADALTWVEAEPGADVPVADASEVEGVADAPAPAAPTPAALPAAPPAPAAGAQPKEVARPVAVARHEVPRVRFAVRGPAPASERAGGPGTDSDAVAVATPGPDAGSGAAGGGADGPAGTAAAGAEVREQAPDLAARFTKELPRYAADIDAWREVDAGESGELELAIRLSDAGRVVKPEQEPPLPREPRDAALARSLQRAVSALVTKLALPGEPVGAGVLHLKVKAKISDGPERAEGDEIELSFSYDSGPRRGLGSFTLRSGRAVTFTVTVTAVEKGAAGAGPGGVAPIPPVSSASTTTPSAPLPP